MPVTRSQLPPPSAELILISVLVQSHLRSMPRRKDKIAFLRGVSEALEWQTEYANVIKLRVGPEEQRVNAARSQASDWWAAVNGRFEALLEED